MSCVITLDAIKYTESSDLEPTFAAISFTPDQIYCGNVGMS